MPLVCFTYKLNDGITHATYEQWVTTFDYPQVRRIPSVTSQTIYRATNNMAGTGLLPYDYIELIEVQDLSAFLNDLQNHPAAQEISKQVGKFTTVVTSTVSEPVGDPILQCGQ